MKKHKPPRLFESRRFLRKFEGTEIFEEISTFGCHPTRDQANTTGRFIRVTITSEVYDILSSQTFTALRIKPESVLSSHLSHVSLRPVPLRPRLLLRRHDVLGLPWSMWWFSPFSITRLGAHLKYCSLAKQANSGYRSLLNAQFNNVYFIAPLCLAGAVRLVVVSLSACCHVVFRL